MWGGADLQTARVSSRHKTDMMAQRYASSALFVYETTVAMDPNARYLVGRFKMAINNHAENVRAVCQETGNNFQNLFQLSQLFLEQIGIGPFHAGRKSAIVVIDHAVNLVPGLGTEQQLQEALSILAEDSRNRINSIVTQMRQKDLYRLEQMSSRLERIDNAMENFSTSLPSESGDVSVSNEPTISLKGKKRGGSENLDEAREFLKKAKGMERLECLTSLRAGHQDTSKLTESARAFVNKDVIPVLKRLEKHHNNDKEKFLERWPLEKALTTFGRKMCNCKGPVCGIC
jgi:hypothetical protein